MLNVTKIKDTESFKIVAESVENENKGLTNTSGTFVGLDPIQGRDYFLGNISERGRY